MGRLHESVEEQRQKMKPKRKCSEKGKILPGTEDVTHSRSGNTSEMMSQQEVDTVTKRKIKAKELKDSLELHSASLRLKQMCSNYAFSMNESTPKSQEKKTKDQEKMTSEENQEFTFDFSKRLIALAREKQAEIRKRRRSVSKTSYRKRKVIGNGGSHDNSGLKRKRQRLSQSQSSWEEFDTTFEKMLNCENELMNETQMKFQSAKRWSTVSNLAPMDFEFSRRLAELSRKRYQHEEHAHCCRCVQSFECFWPRSNLQTIRRQGYC